MEAVPPVTISWNEPIYSLGGTAGGAARNVGGPHSSAAQLRHLRGTLERFKTQSGSRRAALPGEFPD